MLDDQSSLLSDNISDSAEDTDKEDEDEESVEAVSEDDGVFDVDRDSTSAGSHLSNVEFPNLRLPTKQFDNHDRGFDEEEDEDDNNDLEVESKEDSENDSSEVRKQIDVSLFIFFIVHHLNLLEVILVLRRKINQLIWMNHQIQRMRQMKKVKRMRIAAVV